MKVWYDTETCGFVGVPVLLQYATEESEEVHLWEFWRKPIKETQALIEWMMEQTLIGFNLAFDHFQLSKIYTLFDAYVKATPGGEDHIPEFHVQDIAKFERAAMNGPCLKPKVACDLMLLARKGKYQITMERSDMRIRRVPTILAWDLAKELEKQILFDPILFARQKKAGPRWAVRDIVKPNGTHDPNFKDIVLKFKASSGLKALAVSACDFLPEDVLSFKDVDVDKSFRPDEIEYAPFADAVHHKYNKKAKKNKGKTFRPWPVVLEHHIRHWAFHPAARKYASNDVIMTRALWKAFGCPEGGDVDSTLACCVASVRWRGFAVDIPKLQKLYEEALAKVKSTPIAPRRVKAYLEEVMNDVEKMGLDVSKTGKVVLEGIANDPTWKGHPLQDRVKAVMEARFANEEIKLYKKLLLAGRLHFSVKVIGALSSRMSGDNKLNPQGIKRDKKVRVCFPLADGGLLLLLGDFDSFEVGIADAVWGDTRLHAELASGEKIHTLFAQALYPEASKEEIVKSKGSSTLDMYDQGKRGVFSQMYGGNYNTLMTRLGVSEEIARAAEQRWLKNYPGIAKARQSIIDRHSALRQPKGIGTRIEWVEPCDSVASLLGHRRYFTLENRVCKELFQLAQKPLPKWKAVEGKVVRRDRQQTIGGAIMSALYACAFNIQSSITRQAGNHEIQSTGAEITKDTQCKIWAIQPHGVHAWLVQPANIHDEILCPTHPSKKDEVIRTVNAAVEFHRKTIPLIGMEFKEGTTWADK